MRIRRDLVDPQFVWLLSLFVFTGLFEGIATNLLKSKEKTFFEAFLWLGLLGIPLIHIRKFRLRAATRRFWFISILFGMYIVWQSILLEVHPGITLYMLRVFARIFLLTICVIIVLQDKPRSYGYLLKAVIAVNLILSVLTIAQYFTINLPLWKFLQPSVQEDAGLFLLNIENRPFPSVSFSFFSELGTFMLPGAVLVISYAIFSKKNKLWHYGFTIVNVLGVAFSCHRSSQAILIIVILYIIWLRSRKLRIVVVGILIMTIVVCISAAQQLDQKARTQGNAIERFLSLFSPEYWQHMIQTGGAERLGVIISGTAGTFQHHALFGVGYGTIGFNISDSRGMHALNAPYPTYNRTSWIDPIGGGAYIAVIADVGWVALLAQGGVLGLLLSMLWLSNLQRAFAPKEKKDVHAPMEVTGKALVLAACLMNFTYSPYAFKCFVIPGSIVAGIAVVAGTVRRKTAILSNVLVSPQFEKSVTT